MAMRRTGTATLPLHGGRAPRWLFKRMVRLARAISEALVDDLGPAGVLARLVDPFWFQAFGCLLGFDWHSSGMTTTVCGALKEALRGTAGTTGLLVAGGKGAASRRTPDELRDYSGRYSLPGEGLVYASRLAAKVDNNAVQDGYQLYHHTFFVTTGGEWAVVQQGMRAADRTARRYHWLGRTVQSFVVEPHLAVCCDQTGPTLNLVAVEGQASRAAITTLSRRPHQDLLAELARLSAATSAVPADPDLQLPARHAVLREDIHPDRLAATLLRTYEAQAPSFEALLGLRGVGARTLRALALLSEVLAGAPPSWRDPARFTFAHGGKDGHPFPVDRTTYDQTIEILETALRRARLGAPDRLEALRRLQHFAVPPAAS